MSISAEIIPRAIPGLPSREVLAALCSAHSSEHFKHHRTRLSHFIYRPPKRRNLLSFFKSRGTPEPLALIKFGSHVTLGEARTQIYVFQHLKCDPSPPFRVAEVYDAWEDRLTGFIVMEYIPGLAATAMDGPRIAAAIHWLLALPPPDDGRLGPVGGGPMRHCLWRDDEGPTYESVERMDTQINNILKFQGLTVNLSADPICFYHDDIDLRNFLVAGDDLYVTNFEHTGMFSVRIRHITPQCLTLTEVYIVFSQVTGPKDTYDVLTTKLTVPKLVSDGLNWTSYQERIINAITSKKLRRHVVGTTRKPAGLVERDDSFFRDDNSLFLPSYKQIKEHEDAMEDCF
ncbi:hypothetical protein C0989_002037 [Termitomyces sp. Mn162]|nr:hypothetical protein C0989_002037 [Termitomyces sp. Mn162]